MYAAADDLVQGCLQVQAQHTGGLRRYKVRALSDKSARSYVFENEGTETNVAEYFEQRYRKRSAVLNH